MAIVNKLDIEQEVIKNCKKDFFYSRKLELTENKKMGLG
jgi:hypothetical protein